MRIFALHGNDPAFVAPAAERTGVAGTEHLHLPTVIDVRGQRPDERAIEVSARGEQTTFEHRAMHVPDHEPTRLRGAL